MPRLDRWRSSWGDDTTPREPFPAALTGVAVGAATSAFYLVGARRSYGLDEGTSVARFIATPSLLDPFREQAVYNNHVFFSFLDHLVYSLTGSRDELVLRALPVAIAAIAVGLLTYLLVRRWGYLAGVTGAAVVATSPLLVENCRHVRGYSLLVFAAVATTGLLVELRSRGHAWRPSAAYVVVLSAGIATHLYAAAMIPVHAAMLIPSRRALVQWGARWVVAVAIGATALSSVLMSMLSDAQSRMRIFDPRFPVDLAHALLGRTVLTALLLLPLVAVGAWQLRRQMPLLRAGLVVVALVIVTWIAAPRDLYPRFFIWAVPAIGILAARAIARYPGLAGLGAAVIAAQVVWAAPTLTRPDLANESAAVIARAAHERGARICTFGLSTYAMEPYISGVAVLRNLSREQLRRCDLVVQVFTPVADEATTPLEIARAFPYRRVLPAQHPGVVRSRLPLF